MHKKILVVSLALLFVVGVSSLASDYSVPAPGVTIDNSLHSPVKITKVETYWQPGAYWVTVKNVSDFYIMHLVFELERYNTEEELINKQMIGIEFQPRPIWGWSPNPEPLAPNKTKQFLIILDEPYESFLTYIHIWNVELSKDGEVANQYWTDINGYQPLFY